MPDRLTSVRIGARAFLVKPVIVARLIEYLDALTSQQSDEAYRVLIVDDQPLLAATHETVLRQSGMLVSTVTNPLRIFSAMGFVPDLILIDLYMPGCTGVELVAVLRQVDAYIDIPMVYLSAETHLNRQMAALAQGGDDFLTKPIQLDHLVQAVTHRIERTREKRRTLLSRQLRTSAIVDNSISWRPLRVFLCHSKHDKEMARTLYRNLRQMQFQPWLDEEDILPGQDWEQEIREAVHKADVVVICLSQASVTSTGYMHKEVRFALDAAEYQPEKSIFMIPVRLDDCTVPSRLERWQWVNLYEGTGYQQLMKALQRQQAFLTTE